MTAAQIIPFPSAALDLAAARAVLRCDAATDGQRIMALTVLDMHGHRAEADAVAILPQPYGYDNHQHADGQKCRQSWVAVDRFKHDPNFLEMLHSAVLRLGGMSQGDGAATPSPNPPVVDTAKRSTSNPSRAARLICAIGGAVLALTIIQDAPAKIAATVIEAQAQPGSW